jgi:ribosomal protein L13E
MGTVTTALVGLGVLQAGAQIYSGIAASREAKTQGEYNAQIYEQQAGMIEAQQGLEGYQYDRAIRKTRGTTIARTAKAGLLFSGSPVAVMVDTETQLLLDKAIGQYNLEVKKRYTQSGAAEYRRRGAIEARTALLAGYTNAFTSLLQTASLASSRLPTKTEPAKRAGGL